MRLPRCPSHPREEVGIPEKIPGDEEGGGGGGSASQGQRGTKGERRRSSAHAPQLSTGLDRGQ